MIVSKLNRISRHVEFIAGLMTIRIFSMWLRTGSLEPISSPTFPKNMVRALRSTQEPSQGRPG